MRDLDEKVRTKIKSNIRTSHDTNIFTSKGFRQSWIIDLKALAYDVEVLTLFASHFWAYVHSRNEDCSNIQIAALESSAMTLATAVCMTAPSSIGSINCFTIRKSRKASGLGRIIDGSVNNAACYIIDDIVNTGESLERARVILEGEGATVTGVYALIDYHSIAGQCWRVEHSIDISSVFSLRDFGLSLASDKTRPYIEYRSLWSKRLPGGVPSHVVPKSAPVRVGNILFRGCDAGFMHAFKADSGDIVWQFKASAVAPSKGIWSTPSFSEGLLYFGAYNGVLYCLDAATGREVWANACGDWIGSDALVIGEHKLVCIGIEYERPWAKGGLAAFCAATGKKVWEIPIQRYQHGSPAYWKTGDLVIWGSADHETLAIVPGTGEVVWRFPTARSVKASVAIDETRGLVAFANYDKHIYILQASTGSKVAAFETGEICYTTPLFHNGKLYCGSGDKNLYIIHIDNGFEVSKLDMNSRVYGSPRVVGDHVIFGTNGGLLAEIHSVSNNVVGLLQLPDAITNAVELSEDHKTVYVSTAMNDLYAFDRS